MYIPEQGDIIHLQFDPAAGTEMKGEHFGFVVSRKLFNRSGFAFVCPISQGNAQLARNQGLLVTLMGSGLDTQGNIHCHQMKSLDWKIKRAAFKERADDGLVDEVLARLMPLVFE